MSLASPHYDRNCLLTGEGLHEIFRGQRVIPAALLSDAARALPVPMAEMACVGPDDEWRAPRQPRIRARPRTRRNRGRRVLRDLIRWLLHPRAW